MIDEVSIKSHLIITDIHEEFSINWTGKILGTKPRIENGMPIFAIVGGKGRMEVNTTDMKRLEKCAKLLTNPKGRESTTSDTAYIYIIEENGNEKLLGSVTHNHIKTYAQMYDKVGFI